MLPELHQLLQHANGKMNWWGKIKFLFYRLKGVCRKIFGMVFGVVKLYQFKGVEATLLKTAADTIQPNGDTMRLN